MGRGGRRLEGGIQKRRRPRILENSILLLPECLESSGWQFSMVEVSQESQKNRCPRCSLETERRCSQHPPQRSGTCPPASARRRCLGICGTMYSSVRRSANQGLASRSLAMFLKSTLHLNCRNSMALWPAPTRHFREPNSVLKGKLDVSRCSSAQGCFFHIANLDLAIYSPPA